MAESEAGGGGEHRNAGGANNAWLLSPYNTTNFMNANSNGNANNNNASNAYVPSARFCVLPGLLRMSKAAA